MADKSLTRGTWVANEEIFSLAHWIVRDQRGYLRRRFSKLLRSLSELARGIMDVI